jgi:nitrogen fixation-related uncharacterized protein
MKLKIQRQRFESGTYYYLVYEWFWFHWVRRSGLFDTLEEAEKSAVSILEDEKERRKNKKESPVYYQLNGNRITYKKGDGFERGISVGERPLKFKKTENEK